MAMAMAAPSFHIIGGDRSRRKPLRIAAAVLTEPSVSPVERVQGNKRLQTQVSPVVSDVITVRSLDWDRDRFDIEFGLQNGTTYNSYIIQGEKLAIVDASHEKFRGQYLSAIKEQIDPASISYIVANHTEPDHSGLIPDLLNLAPNAVVVGSKVCIQFLQNLILQPIKSLVVKGGEKLDLGGGHVLEFVMAPNLHWPDTMFTFDHGSKILFTCDAFGMHYCSEAVYDEDLSKLEPHYRFYYDCLMRPNARSVLTGLKRAQPLDFSLIATGHGPLLRYNIAELLTKYENWSKEALEKQVASAAVLYVSEYGYSDRLCQALARGLTKTNTGVQMIDLNSTDGQEIVECLSRNSAVVLMTPPSNGPANAAIVTLYATLTNKKPVLIAESYGGDDEPVDTILQRMVELGVPSPLAPLRIKDTPTELTFQEYEEAGTDLGQLLSQKKVIQAKKSQMPANVAKAIGRISSGLYVVSAVKGSSKGAMVASWVSQASFKPMGLTIAVAKDRAIESLMQVGDSFVLNCLEEGNFTQLIKHFLKRFPPGGDRFEGVEWSEGENKSPILKDAVAYLECTVKSRMETSDHWIVYSHITNGDVSKPNGRTAVHHRKIGNYY